MAPKFGTSGLRGLVTELTDALVGDYTRAFLAACDTGGQVFVGWDLRPSSPRIATAVIAAARAEGIDVVRAGMLPTPALALASMSAGAAAIMVTGSHIPADRNGLKFYLPGGEVSKDDEQAINAALGRPAGARSAALAEGAGIAEAYVARYGAAFGAEALTGLRIGVYEHSSAARDIMRDALARLGAEVVALGRSDVFIPVDTEAVDPATGDLFQTWCEAHGLDVIVSTDGDADRPMVSDATGRIVPGDVLGPITAQALGAGVLCTPVSSNSAVDAMGFDRIRRTRIGSPFVIAAMEAERARDPAAPVVGYEANGGFLLGFAAQGPAGPLAPLMTRDSLLPIIAPLVRARAAGLALADLVASMPGRFTASNRVEGIATETSRAFLEEMTSDPVARAAFFEDEPAEASVDLTDGLRVTFQGGDVVHLRPSGNAPEFRCYAEADDRETAEALVARYLARLSDRLG
ncbi:phosphomannomutase [Roseisalinus antarcticus]|uniref:Phosphoglucosamine mutase n=1 Tax=Roseisalinus antarcticus TaxID=254357 RepID=A0A1Y5T602_9RHOB|nr:phosphomannomutase [Roseisalinus antarcticus]SLN56605.1 Phosphoglucosamine mutase [Roseisalinus antarcticus]